MSSASEAAAGDGDHSDTGLTSDGLTDDGLGNDEELVAALGMQERMPPLAPGQVLDEAYRVERLLGSGGMGIVYLARDLKLGREVAIKVHGAVSGEARARLMREATALARLTHPNVVTVYEVGEWSGHPYVVMEYVPGGTARSWLASGRSASEIIALYLSAARGLAAAHAAGLVHRDFKPDNVLVGEDGRVCVADFGLVRRLGQVDAPAREGDGVAAEIAEVTRTGALMGTPGYMAPEQRSRGRTIGPAADQFAFAVSLWEALSGRRPGDPRGSVPTAMPRAVERALDRALSPEPEARWPSMHELIAELEKAKPDLATRRRRAAIALAAVLVAGAASGVTWATLPRSVAAHHPCASAGARLDEAWTDERKALIRSSFLSSGARDAEATYHRVVARLDEYAAAWSAERVEACEAALERGETSAELLDLRNHCLDRRRLALRALADVLATADKGVVDRALDMSMSLPSIAECADLPRLRASPALPQDDDDRRAMEVIEAKIAEARALVASGRFDAGRRAAEEAAKLADALAFPALIAETRLHIGVAAGSLHDEPTARAAFDRALQAAAEAHDDDMAALIAVTMLDLAVSVEQDLVEGARLEPFATAAVTRAGSPPGLTADLEMVIGGLRSRQGKLEEARDALGRAIAVYESETPQRTPRFVTALNRLGNVLRDAKDLDGARRVYERTLSMLGASYGEEHPRIASVLTNLAEVDLDDGDAEKALGLFERAVAIKKEKLGADHPDVASSHEGLARALSKLGRPADARQHADRALSIVEAKLGRSHAWVARALRTRAEVLSAARDQTGALADLERASTIEEKTMGATLDHARTLVRIATLRLDLGDERGARQALEPARAIFEEAGRLESPAAAELRAALARLPGARE